MCGVSGVLSTHAYALTTPPIAWVSAHVSRFFGSDDSDAEEDDAAYGRVRSNSLDMLLAAADKSDHEGPSLSPNDSSGRQTDMQATICSCIPAHTYFERSIFVLSYLLCFVGIVVTTRDCLFIHLAGLVAPASGTGE